MDRLSDGDLLLSTSYHWPGLPWKSNLQSWRGGKRVREAALQLSGRHRRDAGRPAPA